MPLSTPERRKRHRLSQARVRLERLNVESSENVIIHRTRNALVAEFKETNIMTRNRRSLDQVKSPTQRMEQLKKLTPTASKSPKSNASKSSSPSVTPLPKRRSVSDRSSPIPASLKLLSESTGRTAAKTTTRQTAAHSRIPTRTASSASTASSSSAQSPTRTKSNTSRPSNLSQSAPKTRLPLRKSNRSASLVSLRKK